MDNYKIYLLKFMEAKKLLIRFRSKVTGRFVAGHDTDPIYDYTREGIPCKFENGNALIGYFKCYVPSNEWGSFTIEV